MNAEGFGGFDRPFFSHQTKLRELEEQLYGHVLAAIDFDALARAEQQLFWVLSEEHGIDDELALDLAAQIMDRALLRVADDPSRYGDMGPPEGITEAEAKAVAFEEDCPFCIADAESAKRESAHAHVAAEPCAVCDDLAQSWREEHADVLAKHGLGPAADKAS